MNNRQQNEVNQPMITYKEKMKQANREARWALVGFAVIVVAWAILGFGLAGTGIVVGATPLWIIGGCLGTWLVAVAVCAAFSHFVARDMPLDDESEAKTSTTEANNAPTPATKA